MPKDWGGRPPLPSLGAGAALAIHYHSSRGPAEALCEELQGMGCRAFPLQADLNDPAAVEGLFNRAWDGLGGMDFLVNNASIFPAGRLDEIEIHQVHQNLQVNAWAPFLLIREFWRKLRGSGRQGFRREPSGYPFGGGGSCPCRLPPEQGDPGRNHDPYRSGVRP